MSVEALRENPVSGSAGKNPLKESPVNVELEEKLARLEALTQIRDQRKRDNGMNYYVPNRMQFKAHNSICRTILYCGGNRAGKSTFGAMEIAYAVTRRYPDWYPNAKRYTHPVKCVISATSFAIVQRVILPKLEALLPRDYYTSKKTAQGFPTQIRCNDGSTIDVLTLEMDLMAYQGADWDLAWLDEPQSREKFLGIKRGLIDRRGRCIITFTPLTEPWMKEEMADRADGADIDLFTVDIRDNMQTITGEAILSEQTIEEFERDLPEDYKETMMHGKFFHLRGAVYQEFGSEHTDTWNYDGRSPVICVLDPHDRVPHHVIWAFITKDDDIYVDFEWSGHIEIPDLAKKILEVERTRKYSMKRRLIDPNFGRKPSSVGSNQNVMRELAQNRCVFYEANDDVELGHMVVREYLHWNRKKPISAVNRPKIYFHKENCPQTIKSVRNLQYEEWTGKTASERDPKEREKDKENHGADCIRYLCISKPKGTRLYVPDRELETAPY